MRTLSPFLCFLPIVVDNMMCCLCCRVVVDGVMCYGHLKNAVGPFEKISVLAMTARIPLAPFGGSRANARQCTGSYLWVIRGQTKAKLVGKKLLASSR